MHYAANNHSFEIAKLLTDNGADGWAKDNYGQTPLHRASRERNQDMVRFLLAIGADPNKATKLPVKHQTNPSDKATQIPIKQQNSR